jgi:N-acyl-D-aspartate/D-glutamate deacylase
VADVTIFDASKVRDVGTFTDPHHYPEGIPWVLVNGEPVIANNVFTPARPGRIIRRPPARQ